MRLEFRQRLAVLVCAAGALALTALADDTVEPTQSVETIDFRKDVEPILKAHCWKCHGPDKQQGGLRLDRRADALRGGDTYDAAIVPGKSGDSPLFRFVALDDAELKMPPKGERLSASEIGILRSWIDQGLNWPAESPNDSRTFEHWSFRPVVRPAVPTVRQTDWPRTAIDAFILAQLERGDLRPSPEAERATLIRRLYFDLIGLPPTPAEVGQFASDGSPDAYEKLVDRLLDSPQFGERWARHWLDVVRFAESDGYEKNQPRANAWPYRDYVIRAFNEDMPYDRFVLEQLAGDALGADAATGFLVGGAHDAVSSPDPILTAQQRADDLHDIVSTTGSAFLGLTVGCARCHTHKFDPIPQTDYYAMKAVFSGVKHADRPWRSADDNLRQQQLADVRSQLAAADRALDQFTPKASSRRIVAIAVDEPRQVESLTAPAGFSPYAPGIDRGQAGDLGNSARPPNLGRGYRYWGAPPRRDVCAWSPAVAGRFRVWLSWGSGWSSHAADARFVLDRDGRLDSVDDQVEIAVVDQRKFADHSGKAPGVSLWSGFFDAGVHEFRPASRLILRGGDQEAFVTADAIVLEEADKAAPVVADPDSDHVTRIGARQPHLRAPVTQGVNIEAFAPVQAKRLRFVIEDTSEREPCLDELEVFSAEPNPRNVALASAGALATDSGALPGHPLPHVNDGRYGNSSSWISNESGGGWVQIEFGDVITIDRVVWSCDRSPAPKFNDRLPTRYRIETSVEPGRWQIVASSIDRLPPGWPVASGKLFAAPGNNPAASGAFLSATGNRRELHERIKQLESLPAVYAGLFGEAGPTHRLHRGDPTIPKEVVEPGTLSELGPSWHLPTQADEPARRLALGRWIVDRQNPLAARVIVNRLWQQHFGEGLVTTPSDFGVNGAAPSHPELLDWLAAELVQRNWSLKSLHRVMVTSSVYRQSSAANADGRSKDGANRWLWRFSPRRLEAEPLRDAILAVSGRLVTTFCGPGFDLFEENTNYVKVYESKKEFGPAEWRRMVYQSKPRMQLDDTFGAFDCPDAGQIAPRRTRSTTPLQALNLLNGPFVVQQAQFFAKRLVREVGDDPRIQARRGFWLALQREASADELDAAAHLIRQAGLLQFCRALLNANEFLMVY